MNAISLLNGGAIDCAAVQQRDRCGARRVEVAGLQHPVEREPVDPGVVKRIARGGVARGTTCDVREVVGQRATRDGGVDPAARRSGNDAQRHVVLRHRTFGIAKLRPGVESLDEEVQRARHVGSGRDGAAEHERDLECIVRNIAGGVEQVRDLGVGQWLDVDGHHALPSIAAPAAAH